MSFEKFYTQKKLSAALPAGIFFITALTPAAAQNLNPDIPVTEIGWLEGDGDHATHLTTEPDLCLDPASSPEAQRLSDIGAVAFRSPYLFGGLAARKRISCHSCHQNGGSNSSFFITNLSDRPGRIDVTTAIFSKVLEDNQFNPIDIPTLYGLNQKAVFGTFAPLDSKRAFVARVITDEFDGPVPAPRIFDGLMAYVDRFSDSCAGNTSLPGSRPARTSEKDMTAIAQALKTAEQEWRDGHNTTSDFILNTIRHDLGLIYERFDRKSLKRQKLAILTLSRQIGTLRQSLTATPADQNKVTALFAAISSDVVRVSRITAKSQKKSYYRRKHIEKLLTKSGQ